MKIQAVTFDVWETVITDPPELAQARSAARVRLITEALGQAGFPVSEAAVRLAYDRSFQVYEQIWDNNLDLSTAEQMEVILSLLDPALLCRLDGEALAAVSAAYVNPIFDFPPRKKDGLAESLDEVKKLGCKIGLICNTGRSPGWAVRKLLATYGVLDYFEAMAFSDEERIRKPDGEIFRRVLNSLGVAPELAAHVGDNIVTDISGAKNLGMKGILISTALPDGAPVTPDAHITTLQELVPVLAAFNQGLGAGDQGKGVSTAEFAESADN